MLGHACFGFGVGILLTPSLDAQSYLPQTPCEDRVQQVPVTETHGLDALARRSKAKLVRCRPHDWKQPRTGR